MQLDPAIDLLLRCAFFALFASACVHKLVGLTAFQGTVAAYLRGIAPAGGVLVSGAALLALVGEVLAAAACVLPVGHGLRAGLIAGMLLLYAAAMGLNLVRGNTLLDCGCHWGKLRQPVGPALAWRNLGMALVALLLAAPVVERPVQALDLATVAAGTVVAVLLYAIFNHAAASAAQVPGKG